MLYFIRHRGKEHKVRVEARQKQLYVGFDDQPVEAVDMHFQGNDCSYVEEGHVFAANVVGSKNDYTVWMPEGNLSLQVESEYRRIVSALRGQNIVDEGHITAKMPGKIVKILVKPGDEVAQGTPVCVMEAMKMENEIRAAGAGRVSAIVVKEGQPVESGQLLIELATLDA